MLEAMSILTGKTRRQVGRVQSCFGVTVTIGSDGRAVVRCRVCGRTWQPGGAVGEMPARWWACPAGCNGNEGRRRRSLARKANLVGS